MGKTRKITFALLSLVLFFMLAGCLCACSGDTNGQVGINGKDGVDGKSAYQIWLDNGHAGSQTDFLDWLKGADGQDGADGHNGEKGDDGKSAYEIFMHYNPDYTGDEELWIDDLVNNRLIRYTVTFKSYGNEDIVVKTRFYSNELPYVPEVPEKIGNIGYWSKTDFTDITSCITVNAIYETQGLEFVLSHDNTYSVKTTSAFHAKEVFIPSIYNNKPVTLIDARAFKGCSGLVSITIPDSVISIGNEAFDGCVGLTDITIPNSVTSIGENAFGRCRSLLNITIPNSVTHIGYGAFYSCSRLTNITIPKSVTSIEYMAFYDCSDLTSVTIPNSVTNIGESAFSMCSSLASITISDSVTSIDYHAFYLCESLTIIIFNGSKSQWCAIQKVAEWDEHAGNHTIYCTDGNISK